MASLRIVVFLLAAAAAAASEEDLATENARLRGELATLKGADPDAATRRVIEQYLEDSRPAGGAQAATCGFDHGFFLAAADGLHLLRFNLVAQFGWFASRDYSDTHSQAQSVFELESLRLRLSGHAFTERLTFFVDLELAPAARRFQTTADTISEGYFVYHRRPWEHLRFKGGRFRPRFTSGEEAADHALMFAARSLVNEFFTVGRTEGIAIVVENLRGGRSAVELAITNGSERFNPDAPVIADDSRAVVSFRWARTLIGEGVPWTHAAFEGDPGQSAEPVLVLGIGVHFEDTVIGSMAQVQYRQMTVDLMWRREGMWATLNLFGRFHKEGLAGGGGEDFGAHAAFARYLVPGRIALAFRAGWIEYAAVSGGGSDLLEATFSFIFSWRDEAGSVPGDRLKVNLDLGYVQNVALGSMTAELPAGFVQGLVFRALLTVIF
ncbi:MAG: hypothetical protein ACT4PV_05780 [Planctomycetaceae bacterium]